MIIDRIEPIALRLPAPKRPAGVPKPLVNADMCLTLCRVPTGPGLGFDPDPAFLRRHLDAVNR